MSWTNKSPAFELEALGQRVDVYLADNEETDGEWVASETRIYIARRMNLRRRDETLIHELIHTAWCLLGIDQRIPEDEAELYVCATAGVLHQALDTLLGVPWPDTKCPGLGTPKKSNEVDK